ncbi:beta strand repeat-containing protein [Maribacter arcticus]|uniref:Calx-beta domain-containing protein n=1 Tax=Maribacter arcticus TaxID=561365 RepID=A0A1T5EUG9_9FLAO|nr:Calx-beta domain-containing protein [Maribacter arcticus]SKB87595.1 Calx-beta domain-containing protein [Maribacter arcticus]
MKLKYLYSLLFIVVCSSLIYGQQTYLDNFNTVSYSNNNGTSNFSANWNDNEDGSPSNGRIDITGGKLRFNNLDGRTISRTLSLSAATAVTLTMDYDATSLGGEGLYIELWNSGSSSWQIVGTINTNTTGTLSHTLTVNQISANSAIRFSGTDNRWGNGDTILIDNVLFNATFGPTISINNVTVTEEAGNAIFTVTLDKNNSGGFNVNFATANGTALAGSDYTTTSGTLSFVGTIGETKTISIPIIDNSYGEITENFFVNLSGGTNGINISNSSGTGTITDSDPAIPNNVPLTLFEEFSGYFDYTTTGGSLRTQDNNTNACAITTTSSNTLLSPIPAGAIIRKAYLKWAHSSQNVDDVVSFEGQNVTASVIYGSNIGSGRQFYGYMSDVTSLVQAIPNPSTNVYDFTGLTIDTSSTYCSSATVLGGWALMIFYELATMPAVTINLYDGFSGESNSSSTYTLGGFFAIGASGAKTTVLSWEGDQTLSNNELLTVTSGTGTYALTGDGDNNGITVNNPFNSTIFDNTVSPAINQTNPYGLDLDTYNISPYISPGETTVSTTVQSGQDYVIVNSVLLKVPSNLITGTVFEDMNYGGGAGRSLAASSGVGTAATTVELYNALNALVKTSATKPNGSYTIGGMANGNYRVRVVNSTVKSNRTGGAACTTCLPVQTFRRNYATVGGFTNITNRVGGANPAGTDPAAGTITNAQSLSTVTITSEGVVGLDFGFNFNTIVNTNSSGQGSLEKFIVNSNNLENTGLDIVTNGIFDPAAGVDTSIFMIPSTGDPLGRTADANYTSGYFNIFVTGTLSNITDANTSIDGRTQTAYSGNTNMGTLGSGGTAVGISATLLPNFDRPEIHVHRDLGDVFQINASTTTIRNLSVYANDKAGIRINSGSAFVYENILGVNALGVKAGAIQYGIDMQGGTGTIARNYFNGSNIAGMRIAGGTATTVENNHFYQNGIDNCADNILVTNGSGIIIRNNLINQAAGVGIEADTYAAGLLITENTISGNGISLVACSGGVFDDSGIRLKSANATIFKNIIDSNQGEGVVVAENVSGILISQNSIYRNGVRVPSLGIDLDKSRKNGDGVTLNDNGDVDSGPNDLLNFPIISVVYSSGSNLVIEGWSRPGIIIELFLTDINQGTAVVGDNQLGLSTDYGEGHTYIGTVVEGSGADLFSDTALYTDLDGNTDNTNKYKFVIPTPPGVVVGSLLTSTATLSNSTSEFSPSSTIKNYTVITNRRITYRIKSN